MICFDVTAIVGTLKYFCSSFTYLAAQKTHQHRLSYSIQIIQIDIEILGRKKY